MKKETAHFLQSFNRLVQNFSAIKRNVKKLLPTPKSGANLMPKLNEDKVGNSSVLIKITLPESAMSLS